MSKKLTPDEILQNLDNVEDDKGKFKIFLGYSPGVGKTFHMLDLAHELLAKGIDVVVGYIEKHDRKDTLDLLEGFEILPTKEIKYKNIILNELDLQAVINRRPNLVIIDELAHTNAHGMENKKRYEDILEILEHGINVYTTLNIQHIESLTNKVKEITKVKVSEIVPDDFIKLADNIELIDIEPEELLNRINNGQVYKKDKIEDAKNNFFTLENLMRLREIALQYMAKSVDRRNISITLKEEEILLYMNTKKDSNRLLEKAYSLAEDLHCNLVVLGKKNKKIKDLNLKYIEVGNRGASKELKAFLNDNEIKHIIIDKSLFYNRFFMAYFILRKLKKYNIYLI